MDFALQIADGQLAEQIQRQIGPAEMTLEAEINAVELVLRLELIDGHDLRAGDKRCACRSFRGPDAQALVVAVVAVAQQGVESAAAAVADIAFEVQVKIVIVAGFGIDLDRTRIAAWKRDRAWASCLLVRTLKKGRARMGSPMDDAAKLVELSSSIMKPASMPRLCSQSNQYPVPRRKPKRPSSLTGSVKSDLVVLSPNTPALAWGVPGRLVVTRVGKFCRCIQPTRSSPLTHQHEPAGQHSPASPQQGSVAMPDISPTICGLGAVSSVGVWAKVGPTKTSAVPRANNMRFVMAKSLLPNAYHTRLASSLFGVAGCPTFQICLKGGKCRQPA